MMGTRKEKIAYFYDSELSNLDCISRLGVVSRVSFEQVIHPWAGEYTGYYYGADHPMKPQRIAMTHQLILGYGLHHHMKVYVGSVGGELTDMASCPTFIATILPNAAPPTSPVRRTDEVSQRGLYSHAPAHDAGRC